MRSKVNIANTSILIVDDDTTNVQILGTFLRDQEFNIEFATNGDAAISWLESKRFDLILMDVMMPGITGFELCKKIKQNKYYSQIPVIFLTARTESDSIVQGFEAGAVDYLTKPFNSKELLARVTTHITLKKSYDQIEIKNKIITDSLKYAKQIQNTILPKNEYLHSLFSDFFIFYIPKDFVSGDFYWAIDQEDKTYLAVVDCTGHGVPGALMSMIGYTGLNQAINDHKLTDVTDILFHLHDHVQNSLHISIEAKTIVDGMELGLCCIDKKLKTIEFAGVVNSLYQVADNKLTEYKGDRFLLGYMDKNSIKLNKYVINYSNKDKFYMCSDGFGDQFGGEKGKRFQHNKLKKLLEDVSEKPMKEQAKILETTHKEWKGNFIQIDDICVCGFMP